MRFLITGGTGFVGQSLTKELINMGHEVTIVTRSEKKVNGTKNIRFLKADPTVPGNWQAELEIQDVIINLAGSSIFTRWTQDNKKAIKDSRILTTRHLVEGLAMVNGKGKVLFSTSAVGYYGARGEEELNEYSPPGQDFLADVCKEWEGEALKAKMYGTRVVITRFGIVLGRSGGALQRLCFPVRYWLGAALGSGKQWFSWIHEQDLVNIYLFLLDKEIEGPINCTSPNPVRNRELIKTIGEVLKKPVLLPPIPGIILKVILGEFASVLLSGQRVVPKRLLEMGYKFKYPRLKEALEDLLR